jgi:hypothetical protein
VAALPAESGRTFLVQWDGLDDAGGSGVASYNIYMSTHGTTFLRWLTATTKQSAWFVGAPGQSYFFCATARDGVGNEPALLPPVQAMTTVPTNAPVLISVTNFVIRPGDSVSVTNLVVQGTPVGAWVFSLDPGAPAGASINPTNGVLRWTPSCGQASTTNLITVRVTDSGWTNMTDAVSLTVAVSDCVQPGLGQQILLAGDSGRVPIWLISSVPLTNLTIGTNLFLTFSPPPALGPDNYYRAKRTGAVLAPRILSLARLSGTSVLLSFSGVSARTYRVQVTPRLSPPAWETIGTIAPSGDGLVQFTDTNGWGQTQRFYRLVWP